jgi:hypothetical protein
MRVIVGLGLCATLLAVIGCGGDVTIDHTLPAAAPVPDATRPLATGEVSIRGSDVEGLPAVAKRELSAALNDLRAPNAGAPAAQVHAEIHVDVTDQRGSRTVRRGRPDGNMPTVTLPTLVRKVDVRAELPVRQNDRTVVTLSVRRSYDSRRDPRVWGDLALGRPADPNRVPSREVILRELVTDCMRSGADLLRPGRVTATVPLKHTFHSVGRRGLKALRAGEYTVAVRLLSDALDEAPTDRALLYNHAVACEAGQLQRALMGYRKVLEDGHDEHALDGAKRVQLVIRHRKDALPDD